RYGPGRTLVYRASALRLLSGGRGPYRFVTDTHVHKGAPMPDFGEFVNKAKDMAGEHPDQVAKGIDKLEEFVDNKTGGQYSGQIESAGNAVGNYLGAQGTGQQQDQQGQSGRQDEGWQQENQFNDTQNQ